MHTKVVTVVGVLLALAISPAMPVSTAIGAQAGVTYTWAGAGDASSWASPGNWLPTGVPGPTDEAIIDGSVEVDIGGDIEVGGLHLGPETSLYGTDHATRTAYTLTVLDELSWNGAEVRTGLTVASGAVGSIDGDPLYFPDEESVPLSIDGSVELTGALKLRAHVDVGTSGHLDLNAAHVYRVCDCFDPLLTIDGRLSASEGTSQIVTDGAWNGEVSVTPEANLIVRQSSTATGTFSGRGTFTLLGTMSLADDINITDGTRLRLGDGGLNSGIMVGAGDVHGTGVIELAEGGWLATSVLDPAITFLSNGGLIGDTDHAPNVGFQGVGQLTIGTTAKVFAGTRLCIHDDTSERQRPTIRVPSGSTFDVRGRVNPHSCRADDGLLVGVPGSLLTFTRLALVDAAQLHGTVDLNETGMLKAKRIDIDGAEVEASGRRTLIQAARELTGRPSCIRAPGFVPVYSATALNLRRFPEAPASCLTNNPKVLLDRTVSGRQSVRLGRDPGNVMSGLVRVKITRASERATITIGGTRFELSESGKARGFLIVPANARLEVRVPAGRAHVRLTRSGWYLR
ncbi:hypothetical protein [Nocardioides pelophilus]|uniref:hypothetical protein n=1 Tax=Nocardioides pelophilus TaxID=2172019 RepID=UPI0016039F7D|nr:hypothetical protein [Nocardioides pelophilus]